MNVEMEGYLREAVKYCKALGWANQRTWSEFFARFVVPKTTSPQKLSEHVWTNVLYYRSNYLFIVAILSLYTLIMRPLLLSAICFLIAAWIYFFHLRADEPIFIKGVHVTRPKKLQAFSAAVFVTLWLVGGLTSIFWILASSALLIGLHAVFRPTTMKSKASQLGTEFRMKAQDVLSSGGEGSDQDEEAGGVGEARTGPVPGTVESRRNRNEAFTKRREALAQRYPHLSTQ